MDPSRARRRYVTAHELGQSVYWTEGDRRRRVPRPEDLQRGLQVHARLQAVHIGRSVPSKRALAWECVAAGVCLSLILGVALWIR